MRVGGKFSESFAVDKGRNEEKGRCLLEGVRTKGQKGSEKMR